MNAVIVRRREKERRGEREREVLKPEFNNYRQIIEHPDF